MNGIAGNSSSRAVAPQPGVGNIRPRGPIPPPPPMVGRIVGFEDDGGYPSMDDTSIIISNGNPLQVPPEAARHIPAPIARAPPQPIQRAPQPPAIISSPPIGNASPPAPQPAPSILLPPLIESSIPQPLMSNQIPDWYNPPPLPPLPLASHTTSFSGPVITPVSSYPSGGDFPQGWGNVTNPQINPFPHHLLR